MRMWPNGMRHQPSKLATRVRLPPSAPRAGSSAAERLTLNQTGEGPIPSRRTGEYVQLAERPSPNLGGCGSDSRLAYLIPLSSIWQSTWF